MTDQNEGRHRVETALEAARVAIMEADERMQPGRAQMGPALACIANAVQALTDGLEALSRALDD